MLFTELNRKKIKKEVKTVIEAYDPVRTIYGDCDVERLWLQISIRVEEEKGRQIADELLGYRVLMPKKIKSDVCLNIMDAIKSGEARYKVYMDKVVNKVKGTV